MHYRFCGAGTILLIFLGLLLPYAASAQAAPQAILAPPKTDTFPRLETYLDVRDAQGHFVHGLKAKDFQIIEDGQRIQLKQADEMRPGLQIVVALNPGPAFAARDRQATTRYATMLNDLKKWAQDRQGSTLDDWSLLIHQSTEVTHLAKPGDWAASLNSESVDIRNATPSPDLISQALDLAADAPPRPEMGRVVLLITNPMENQLAPSLTNLAARANQQGIRIFAWLVSAPGIPATDTTKQLQDLTTQTDGQLLSYAGGTPLDPESILAPLRSAYRLIYTSQIKASGNHQVAVEVKNGSQAIQSAGRSFTIDIQPPNPAFVSPVLEIQRKPAQPGNQANDNSNTELLPAEQEMQILIDFPDGRVRPLMRTTLFVDGAIAAENLSPPFEQFTWDLRAYAASGEHTLHVEAEDELGMIGKSIDTVIRVRVEQPLQTPWKALTRRTPLLVIPAVLLAGAILMLVLILGGKVRPANSRPSTRGRKGDPVTQPVPVKMEPAPRRLPSWVNRLQWPQRHPALKTYALLIRLSETDNPSTAPPIPISSDEVTLGSDPNQAALVLADPSVEGLHARLILRTDGTFRLVDEGSIAGTWINYTPVSREGAALQHGDLIHIGRVEFRFSVRQPTHARKPVVTRQKEPRERLP